MEIGLAIFKPTFTDERKTQLLTNEDIRILKSPSWQFYKVQSKRWAAIFAEIESSVCQGLFIYQNDNSIFLKLITPISFTCLTKLTITDAEITNIEDYAFINAPNLESLRLSENMVTNSKPINKVHFPKIKYLILEQKKVSQVQLSRYWMKVPASYVMYEHEGNIGLQQVLINWTKQSHYRKIGEQGKGTFRKWFKSYRAQGFVLEKVFQSVIRSFS